MIFGESNDELIKRVTTPHRWFAWRPVTLENGRTAWLQYVMRYKLRWPLPDFRSVSPFWRYYEEDDTER